ncbi:unnamed protein product, partial [Dovyalis caffra]
MGLRWPSGPEVRLTLLLGGGARPLFLLALEGRAPVRGAAPGESYFARPRLGPCGAEVRHPLDGGTFVASRSMRLLRPSA